jgi:hypothetical protein
MEAEAYSNLVEQFEVGCPIYEDWFFCWQALVSLL